MVIGTWLLVGALAAGGAYVLLVQRNVGGIAGLVAAAFGVALMRSGWLNGRMVQGGFTHLIGHAITLTAADDGLHSATDSGTSVLNWSAIHTVAEDQRVLVIAVNSNALWAIIAKKAVGGEDLKAFRRAIELHHGAAHSGDIERR